MDKYIKTISFYKSKFYNKIIKLLINKITFIFISKFCTEIFAHKKIIEHLIYYPFDSTSIKGPT